MNLHYASLNLHLVSFSSLLLLRWEGLVSSLAVASIGSTHVIVGVLLTRAGHQAPGHYDMRARMQRLHSCNMLSRAKLLS
eukprot:3019974-Amphidinium_carterae.1